MKKITKINKLNETFYIKGFRVTVKHHSDNLYVFVNKQVAVKYYLWYKEEEDVVIQNKIDTINSIKFYRKKKNIKDVLEDVKKFIFKKLHKNIKTLKYENNNKEDEIILDFTSKTFYKRIFVFRNKDDNSLYLIDLLIDRAFGGLINEGRIIVKLKIHNLTLYALNDKKILDKKLSLYGTSHHGGSEQCFICTESSFNNFKTSIEGTLDDVQIPTITKIN